MRRVAIIGASGQLGTDCVAEFEAAGYDVQPLGHDQLEIADDSAVREVFGRLRPDVVVNTAAMHNVEACEADPAGAFRVNAIGVRNLARAASAQGFRLIHLSTDYVFDGAAREPYTESSLPSPVNVYGNSKLSGEHFVVSEGGDAVVVRTSGLYGRAECRAKQGGLNFVRRMLQLARERGMVQVVTDEFVTPTSTVDLARQLVALAESDLQGVVHATSQGQCSWYEFAAAIFELSGVEVDLRPAKSADFPAKVRRPAYSVLDNSRLRGANIDRMPPWRAALERYLESIGELAAPSAAPASAPR